MVTRRRSAVPSSWAWVAAAALAAVACGDSHGEGDEDGDDDDVGGSAAGITGTGGSTSGSSGGSGTAGKGGTAGSSGTGGTAGKGGSGGQGGTSGKGGSGGTGARPDLSFDRFYTEGYTAGEETIVYAEIIVRNRTAYDAPPPHRFSLVVSPDNEIGDDNDIEIYYAITDFEIPAEDTLSIHGFEIMGYTVVPQEVPDGFYTLGGIIDSRNELVEASEANNTATGARVFVGIPDYNVEAVTIDWSPASLVADADVGVEVTLENQGNLPVESVEIDVFVSADATLDTTDRFFCNDTVDVNLDPGERATVTLDCTVPRLRGSYYLGAELDRGDALAESDENNNVILSDAPTIVSAHSLDLTVTTATLGTTDVEWNGDVDVSATVANSGPDPAPAFRVGFALSSDAVFDSGDVLMCQTTLQSALASGASATATSSCRVPPQVTGGRRLIAIADVDDGVFELDEANNALVAAGSLTVAPPDADLAFIGYTDSGMSVLTVGQTLTMRVRVGHAGSDPVSSFDAGVYFSTDANILTSDELVCTQTLGPLAAGATVEFTFTCEVPDVSPGRYYTGVILDPERALAETDETNNVGAFSARDIVGG